MENSVPAFYSSKGHLLIAHRTDEVISKNAALQSLITTGVKPSFLIWDKVYQKLTTTDEETWLLRASEKALLSSKTQLLQNEQAW